MPRCKFMFTLNNGTYEVLICRCRHNLLNVYCCMGYRLWFSCKGQGRKFPYRNPWGNRIQVNYSMSVHRKRSDILPSRFQQTSLPMRYPSSFFWDHMKSRFHCACDKTFGEVLNCSTDCSMRTICCRHLVVLFLTTTNKRHFTYVGIERS